MKQLLRITWLALLATSVAAQAPKATNSLDFDNGSKISVSFRQINVAEGVTIKTLMAEGEEGDNYRKYFNDQGFTNAIGGTMKLNETSEINGNLLDSGSYRLTFRIDEDRIWYLVILTKKDEEVVSIVLDVTEDEENASKRLGLRPTATNNRKAEGNLAIRFGSMTASVPFRTGVKG